MPSRNQAKFNKRVSLLKGATRFWALNPDLSYFGYQPNDKRLSNFLQKNVPGFDPNNPDFAAAAHYLEQNYPQIQTTAQASGPLDQKLGTVRGFGGPRFEKMITDLQAETQLERTTEDFFESSPRFIGPNKETVREAVRQAALEQTLDEENVTLEEVNNNPQLKARTEQIINQKLALEDAKSNLAERTLAKLPAYFREPYLSQEVYQATGQFLNEVATPAAEEFAEATTNTPLVKTKRGRTRQDFQVRKAQVRFNRRITGLANHRDVSVRTQYYDSLGRTVNSRFQNLRVPDEQKELLIEQVKSALHQTIQSEPIAPQALYQVKINPRAEPLTSGNKTDLRLEITTPPVSFRQRTRQAWQFTQRNWRSSTCLIGGANTWLKYTGPAGFKIMLHSTLKHPIKQATKYLSSGGLTLLHRLTPEDYEAAWQLASIYRSKYIKFQEKWMWFKHPVWALNNWLAQTLVRRPLNFIGLQLGLVGIKYKTLGFGAAKTQMYPTLYFKPWDLFKKGVSQLPGLSWKATKGTGRWGKEKTALAWKPLANRTRPIRKKARKKTKDILKKIYDKTLGAFFNKITQLLARITARITLQLARFATTKIGQAFLRSRFGSALKNWITQGIKGRFASFLVNHQSLSLALKGTGVIGKFLLSHGLSAMFNLALWITDPIGMFVSTVYLGSPGGFLGGTAMAAAGYYLFGLPGALGGFVIGSTAGHLAWSGMAKLVSTEIFKNLAAAYFPKLGGLLARFFQIFKFNPGSILGSIGGYYLGLLLGLPGWATLALTIGSSILGTILWAHFITPILQAVWTALSALVSSILTPISAAVVALGGGSLLLGIVVVSGFVFFFTTVVISSIVIYQDIRITLAPNESACFIVNKEYYIADGQTGEEKEKAEANDLIYYTISVTPRTPVVENVSINDEILYGSISIIGEKWYIDPDSISIIQNTSGEEITTSRKVVGGEYSPVYFKVLSLRIPQLTQTISFTYQLQVDSRYEESFGPIENMLIVDGEAVDDEGEKLECLIKINRFVNGSCQEIANIATGIVDNLQGCLGTPAIVNQNSWTDTETCLENASVSNNIIETFRYSVFEYEDWDTLQCVAFVYGIAGYCGHTLPGNLGGARNLWTRETPGFTKYLAAENNKDYLTMGDLLVWTGDTSGHVAIVTHIYKDLLGDFNQIQIAEAMGDTGIVRTRDIPYHHTYIGFLHCE